MHKIRRGEKSAKKESTFPKLKGQDLWTIVKRGLPHKHITENFQSKEKIWWGGAQRQAPEFRKAQGFLALEENDMIPSKPWEKVIFNIAKALCLLTPTSRYRSRIKTGIASHIPSRETWRALRFIQRAYEGRGKCGVQRQEKGGALAAAEGATHAGSWATGPRTSSLGRELTW